MGLRRIDVASYGHLIIWNARMEGYVLVTQKLQLFPSSQGFDLDGIPIFDCPTFHATFRPFGALSFFLGPCKLENFEKATRCNPSNSPSDSTYISPLPTLRKHLEFYIRWRSSVCFQLFDRGLPDLVMQSIFTDEYPLIHGSGLKTSFETAMKMAFEDKEMMAINKIRCCRNQWWMIDPILYLSCVSFGS